MFNKSQILTRAWEIYRNKLAMISGMNAAGKRLTFESALRRAWMEAKSPAP